jgi:hypothetical protein
MFLLSESGFSGFKDSQDKEIGRKEDWKLRLPTFLASLQEREGKQLWRRN